MLLGLLIPAASLVAVGYATSKTAAVALLALSVRTIIEVEKYFHIIGDMVDIDPLSSTLDPAQVRFYFNQLLV